MTAGPAAGTVFSAVIDQTPGAAAESSQALVVNLSTSTKNLYFTRFSFQAISALGSATGVESVARIYTFPVVTSSGTFVTPQSLQVVASSQTSVMQAFKTPTTTSNGNLVGAITAGSMASSTADYLPSRNFILGPGRKILVTVQGTVNGPSEYALVMEWVEN